MHCKQILSSAMAMVLCAPWIPSGAASPEALGSLGRNAFFLFEDDTLTPEENGLYSNYPVVDSGQATCFDDMDSIDCPVADADWYGQDAQFQGNAPDYSLSDDVLTVHDNVTGLIWQQTADLDGDGDIDVDDKLTWSEIQAYVENLNAQGYGGYNDWRLPTIKELYSLMDFRGTDPRPEQIETQGLFPFIDTDYFSFGYGDVDAGERVIDSQWASSTLYVADDNLLFGVNFADGRIKGYGRNAPSGQGEKTFYVRLCRGNTAYGVNIFRDNGDDTVTDRATGLTWMRADSGQSMDWRDALAYCADSEHAGLDDWRLPNAKELHSIVDYGRSPDTTGSAAIDAVFASTSIVNEGGLDDFPYYWSSTTHISADGLGHNAVYVSFGRGLGQIDGTLVDIHGAGSQRSDPKLGDPADYPQSLGPQGDIRRVFNYVRCVRDGVELADPGPDTGQPPVIGPGFARPGFGGRGFDGPNRLNL